MCIFMLNKNLFIFSHSYNFFKYKGFYILANKLKYDFLTWNLFITHPNYTYLQMRLKGNLEITSKLYDYNIRENIIAILDRYKIRKFTQELFTPLCAPYLIHKYIILRHLWCKSYKGKCHVSGKPVSGQNNWSNGWGSYKTNTVIRLFLRQQKIRRHKIRKFKNKIKVTRKLKMQIIQKPVKKKHMKKKPVKKKKFDVWS